MSSPSCTAKALHLLILIVAIYIPLFVIVVVRTKANSPVDLSLTLQVGGSEANAAEDLVHLLETEALGFGDEEEDEETTEEREHAEEDESAEAKLPYHGRRHLANDEVVHPVG